MLAAVAVVGLTTSLAYAPMWASAMLGIGLLVGSLLASHDRSRVASTADDSALPSITTRSADATPTPTLEEMTRTPASPNVHQRLESALNTREQQLETIRSLTDHALDGSDEATLVGAAVTATRTALRCDGCEIYRTVDTTPQLAAGVGPGGIQLDRRSTTIRGSALAATLSTRSGAAFEVDGGLVTEPQLPISATAVAVPIVGPDGMAGAFMARWSSARSLRQTDVDFMSAVAGLLALTRRQRGAEQDAFRQSRHDALTGLVNRDVFLERLGTAVSQSGPEGEVVAVLLADLDHFKIINDSLGHSAGDDLISAVSERFRSALRPGDTLARLGGDEFVVLARRLGDPGQAVFAAQRLQSVLSEPFSISGHEVQATASVGVAVCSDATQDAGELMGAADAALYHAKERGRERIEVFEPSMHDAALARLTTEEQLRAAIQEGQLRVLYQPIIDLGTGQADGVEALVRWLHPTRGMVSPAEFIPISEATGLIEEVGAWVIDEVARQARAWVDAGSPMRVSVNISPRQLVDTNLLRTIDLALETHGISGDLLTVEVTESALMSDVDAATDALAQIDERGIKIAIDDFGTGPTSIPHLRTLPIDIVKIDGSLVSGIGHSGDDYAIVSTMIQLARILGTRVLAEGVETEQQLELLRDLGCDLAQGFLFSPAVFDVVGVRGAAVAWEVPTALAPSAPAKNL